MTSLMKVSAAFAVLCSALFAAGCDDGREEYKRAQEESIDAAFHCGVTLGVLAASEFIASNRYDVTLAEIHERAEAMRNE